MLHQIGLKLRTRMGHFLGKLSEEMGKIQSGFVGEAIYGIQARRLVRISEIARSSSERTSIKKRIDRLSRNLALPGLDCEISEAVLAQGATLVKQDTLLILDPTDITKKYAGKMECLAKVRDGSAKEIGLRPTLIPRRLPRWFTVCILKMRRSLSARIGNSSM